MEKKEKTIEEHSRVKTVREENEVSDSDSSSEEEELVADSGFFD